MSDDGQHRAYPTGHPGPATGQTSRTVSGAFVGQKNGSEANMKVPATDKRADISTTSNSAGKR